MRKMNRNAAAALSVLFGLLTVLLFKWGLQKKEAADTQRAASSVQVVAARTGIAPRSLVMPEMLEMRTVSEADAPPDALRSINRAIGMATTRGIEPGDVIREVDLSQKSTVLGLAYDIPSNMRAVSVALDPVTGVSGFLKPGDRVDVLATYTSSNQVNVTKTVLQDVSLLAIGSQPASTANYRGTGESAPMSGKEKATEAQPEAPTATLAVFPDQAQALVMAQAKGRIHLILRPPDDRAVKLMQPVTSSRVFGVTERELGGSSPAPAPVAVRTPAPAPAPAPPVRIVPLAPRPVAPPPAPPVDDTVTVIRGIEQSKVSVK